MIQSQKPNRPTSARNILPSWQNLLQGVAESTKLLLTTQDYNRAINLALKTLGQVTGVDRVYIFQIHPHPEIDRLSISQKFEWARETVSAQINNPLLQNFTFAAERMNRWYEDLCNGKSISGLVEDFPEFERELLTSQEVLSILMVPIPVNNQLWGFIGFDDCHFKRQWSKDEEAVLMTMAATLGGVIAQRQTEQELQEREKQYRAIFEATRDGLMINDLEGSIVEANPAAHQMHGYTYEEFIGLHPKDFVHPDFHHIIAEFIQTIQRGVQFEGEAIGIRKNKTYFPIEVRGTTFTYKGKPHMLGLARDITERKRAEQALRESEEKFRSAFRSSPNPISISRLEEERFIEVNDSFLHISGYEREEVIGHTVTELNIWAKPETRTVVRQILQKEGSVRNVEFEFRCKSGEVGVGLFSADIINIADDPCLLSVLHDITARKKAEEQLRTAADRDRLLAQIALRIRRSLNLDQILNTTVAEVRQFLQADRVFIGHADNGKGQILVESVEPNYPSILSWVIEDESYLQELQGMFEHNRVKIVDDIAQATFSPCIAQYLSQYQVKAGLGVPIWLGERLFGALVVHQCSKTRHWQPFEIELLEQLATQVAIAIQQAELYQQVQTLNENLERQVEERTRELQQAVAELQELNQVKDLFLHAVTHDLRTPVMGWLLVLKNLLNQPGERITISRSILERMIQSSDRQLHLINSLLEVHTSEARGIELHPEPVRLSELTWAVIQDLEPFLAKNEATLKNLVSADLPVVKADPAQLWRVFENLLANALNHNPPGLLLTLNATVEGSVIRCTLQDNGIGMDREMCDRLFELYARGSHVRRSTGIGLGLYLCRQIIAAHGGEIGAIGSPGAGATFWFTLPLGTRQ